MNYEEDAATLAKKDSTPVWVENEHGVKSCWPKEVAKKLVQKNYEWKFAVPEEVPGQKQYPLGMGELKESGIKRRLAAQESQGLSRDRSAEKKAEETKNLSLDDLRSKAKKLKIGRYWVKSEARLLKEIGEKEV